MAGVFGLIARFKREIHELGKFGVIGAVAWVVDTAVFKACLDANANQYLAAVISTLVSATVAFLGNRFWTWRHRAHDNMARQYTMFFLLNAVGLGIGLACLAISHYGLGQIWPALQSPIADNVSGQLIGTALGTLFRFWSYRRFVFPEAVRPEGDPVTHERAVVPRM